MSAFDPSIIFSRQRTKTTLLQVNEIVQRQTQNIQEYIQTKQTNYFPKCTPRLFDCV